MSWRRSSTLCLLPFCLAVTGCTNALYFYETGKMSLTIEGRPDSSQPVQGSLAFKQRTAFVSPPIITDADGHMADTSSMISSFRLKKENTWFGFGPITVRTALVTGAAALCLDKTKAQQTAAAVTGAPIPTFNENVALAIKNAETNGKKDRLIVLAKKKFPDLENPAGDATHLSKNEVIELQSPDFTQMGEFYDSKMHDAVAKQLGVRS